MSRFTNPVPQFWLDNGTAAASGLIEFYENGNFSAKKDTFADSGLTIKNTNPVNLDGQGRMPPCFGQGLYSVKLYAYDNSAIDKKGALQWSRNDVDMTGGGAGAFDDWSAVVTYALGDAAKDNGKYYSLYGGATSKGERPSTTPAKWEEIAFLTVFNTNKTYSEDEIVISGGFIYRSLEDNNNDSPPSAKWGNLTFNDSVAGDFTVGGIMSCVEIDNDTFANFPEVKTSFRNSQLASVTSTLSIDPSLTLSALPIGWYDVEVYLQYTTGSNNTNGITVDIVQTDGNSYGFNTSGAWQYVKSSTTVADFSNRFNSTTITVYPSDPAGRNSLLFKGMINNTAVIGMGVRWAQGTSTPGHATTVISAYIKATRLKDL